MNSVLIYEVPKTGQTLVWDASTDQLKAEAFLDLFKFLDKELRMYIRAQLPIAQAQMYAQARKGNPEYAEAFLRIRKKNEYEGFTEAPVHVVGGGMLSHPIRPRTVVKIEPPIDTDISIEQEELV